MTRPGKHPLDDAILQRAALLYQLHCLTHPCRIGRILGISGEYVRRQWRDVAMPDAQSLEEVLSRVRELSEATLVG